MPEDTFAEDRATHGKSALRDPAQRRLIEQEVISQQNPLKQPPNRYTTLDRGEPPHGRETRADMVELGTSEGDTFEA